MSVGVILFCPQSGYFDLKLETRKQGRVTDFFPELDKSIFRLGRQNFCTELKRVRDLLTRNHRGADNVGRVSIFSELVKHRESLFRFNEVSTILAEDPLVKLQELFDHCVNRQFAQGREYQETVLAKRVNEVLRTHDLARYYRMNRRVGNDDFHVILPILSEATNEAGEARRVIKPLDLDRDEPTKIYEHGDQWVKPVERLKHVNRLPDGMLFTIRAPGNGDRGFRACEEVCGELTRLGVRVLPYQGENGLLEFAKFDTKRASRG